MKVVQQGGYACLALGLLGSLTASCGDSHQGGRSARVRDFFTATHDAVDAACACNPELSCGGIASYECAGPIIERYEDQLAAYIDCAIPAYAEVQACLEASDCALDTSDCFDQFGPEAVCPEIPEALDDRVEDELEVACPEPIDCRDGSSAEGQECNGIAECADGSDEDVCGGETALSAQR